MAAQGGASAVRAGRGSLTPAPGPTAGLLNQVLIPLGVAVVYRPAEGAGAFGWAVNEEGDLRSACVTRSETGHSATKSWVLLETEFKNSAGGGPNLQRPPSHTALGTPASGFGVRGNSDPGLRTARFACGAPPRAVLVPPLRG